MTDLVLVDRLGDITFGLPEDFAPHKNPWAYYELLGVDRDAPPEDIKKAIKRLSKENHPDKFATQGEKAQKEAGERQRLINEIGDLLLDDGGELGEEWSRRKLYDNISHYSEFFGAAHIEYEGQRTATIAENLLDLSELKKRGAEEKHQFKIENPEVAEEIERLESAVREHNRYSAERSHRKIIEALAAKEEITPDEFERRQREAIAEDQKLKEERYRENGYNFVKFLYDTDKVFDIWYNGKRRDYCSPRVEFTTSNYYPLYSIVGFKEEGSIVRLGLEENAILPGMRKVHFKAQYASNVYINDPHLEGIFQLVGGFLCIKYNESSYGGNAIRARARDIDASSDFVQHGDLFIPKSFASEGWEQREPKIDIAVFDGIVCLEMEQKVIQQQTTSYSVVSAIKKKSCYY